MLHSFVSWDCTYRNFYHLIDALINQDFDRGQWELVFVEQRTKRYANAYNRALGLPSLWDHYEEVKDEINMKVIYMGDPWREPYHIGRCHNAGLEAAKGEIVSMMDGDQLLPPDFLNVLTRFHERNPAGIACLARHMADRPACVPEENWTEAIFHIDEVLAVCPYGYDPYPVSDVPTSAGPLLSARREYWDVADGYDPHPVWSTAIVGGGDMPRRLEMTTGTKARQLMGTYAVHPWHPVGWGRGRRAVKNEGVAEYLDLQKEIVAATTSPNWQTRIATADRLYEANRELVNGIRKAETKALRQLYLEAKG